MIGAQRSLLDPQSLSPLLNRTEHLVPAKITTFSNYLRNEDLDPSYLAFPLLSCMMLSLSRYQVVSGVLSQLEGGGCW